MLNQNITQRETQEKCLGDMISRCSPDSQHGGSERHPPNVGCSFFRYMNDDLRNHTNQRRKHKTWTMEGNQIALHSYFSNNPIQRGYRKKSDNDLLRMRQFSDNKTNNYRPSRDSYNERLVF